MAIFDHLRTRQEQIEAEYGGTLYWEELPGKRACRVADYKDGCSVLDRERHEEYIGWFLDTGVRMRRAMTAAALPL